jgi:RNA polymerase sigma-70 factor (ECF subfamily)
MNAIALDACATTPGPHSRPRAASRRMSSVPGSPGLGGPALAACIVRIAERGDRDAFSHLFNHFAPRVKSYLMRLGTGSEAAEELAQETLLTVWRRAAAFDPDRAAASTWIFTIARNLRIDLSRREGRAPPTDDTSAIGEAPASPEEALSALEDKTRIGIAVASLPREQAQVISLAFFADKAHSEIAGELGLPLGTVKSRLRLAMARLRGALAEIAP